MDCISLEKKPPRKKLETGNLSTDSLHSPVLLGNIHQANISDQIRISKFWPLKVHTT